MELKIHISDIVAARYTKNHYVVYILEIYLKIYYNYRNDGKWMVP